MTEIEDAGCETETGTQLFSVLLVFVFITPYKSDLRGNLNVGYGKIFLFHSLKKKFQATNYPGW